MPGPPPWPNGVGRIVLEYDVDGHSVTTSNWFLSPSAVHADVATCRVVIDQWVTLCAGELAAIMSAAAELTACSVTISSPFYAHVREQLDPIPGVWSGAQALNVAAGLHFLGSVRGRGTASVMRIPSVPDFFVDSTWRLSSNGYANLRDRGATYLNRFNAIDVGAGSTLLLGCLHRRHAGADLVPPVFDPTYDVIPSPRLLTIRRRLPRGPAVSPT